MAKTYGISDRRIGSVGQNTYTIVSGQCIVKEKIIKVKDAKTKSQVKQRAFMMAAQNGLRDISTEFIQKCFEKKPKLQSYANIFTSKNVKEAYVIRKDYAKDSDIIGIGNWRVSHGSLVTGLHLIANAKDNTTEYIGLKIKNDTALAADGNDTVGAVSTELLQAYPFLKEGMIINVVAVVNVDVKFKNSAAEPLEFASPDYFIKRIKQNFVLNKTDNAKMTTKGFTVKKGNDNAGYLLILEEDLTTVCEGLKNADGADLSYAGLVVSHVNGRKTLVQTCECQVNKPLGGLMELLESDLEGDCVNLKSYGYNEDAAIINDDAI